MISDVAPTITQFVGKGRDDVPEGASDDESLVHFTHLKRKAVVTTDYPDQALLATTSADVSATPTVDALQPPDATTLTIPQPPWSKKKRPVSRAG